MSSFLNLGYLRLMVKESFQSISAAKGFFNHYFLNTLTHRLSDYWRSQYFPPNSFLNEAQTLQLILQRSLKILTVLSALAGFTFLSQRSHQRWNVFVFFLPSQFISINSCPTNTPSLLLNKFFIIILVWLNVLVDIHHSAPV